MSDIADIETEIGTWIDDLRAKADQAEQRFRPVVHDAANALAQLTSSRIVSELQQFGEDVLPGTTVDSIVGLIRDAGTAAARIAELTAPPAEPAAEEPPAQ